MQRSWGKTWRMQTSSSMRSFVITWCVRLRDRIWEWWKRLFVEVQTRPSVCARATLNRNANDNRIFWRKKYMCSAVLEEIYRLLVRETFHLNQTEPSGYGRQQQFLCLHDLLIKLHAAVFEENLKNHLMSGKWNKNLHLLLDTFLKGLKFLSIRMEQSNFYILYTFFFKLIFFICSWFTAVSIKKCS